MLYKQYKHFVEEVSGFFLCLDFDLIKEDIPTYKFVENLGLLTLDEKFYIKNVSAVIKAISFNLNAFSHSLVLQICPSVSQSVSLGRV